jgi:hypothetical protein
MLISRFTLIIEKHLPDKVKTHRLPTSLNCVIYYVE